MRQYMILYKRGAGGGPADFARLQPVLHRQLYDRFDVNEAVEHMRKNQSVVGMAIQNGDELWNLISFKQDALAPNSFEFNDGPIVPNEPVDAQAILEAAGATS